ncbi:hypothetical protein CFP59_06126 [Streptomyces malaysiensis subsp. malaysiensis]|uniref:hypothetical protein n=1 Tax=Streptomyces malaysiensis TaxID=92644 RepID=UPI000CA2D418|nr:MULTISPECIES: hypothetical protein [unclassified Streptomyces]AUA13952.1 hypothetical protein CFP59_06126 [Streptomyces sp. M56]
MTTLSSPATGPRPARRTRRALSRRQVLPWRRELAWRRVRPEWVLLVSGAALVPWLYVLARTVPSTALVGRWNAAWVGLDALEALGLLSTAALRRRADDRHRLTAAATAALLVVDAWWDTVTAAPGGALVSAVAMAVCAELPLAALCTALALGRERRPVTDTTTVGTTTAPGPPVAPRTPITPGRRPTRE